MPAGSASSRTRTRGRSGPGAGSRTRGGGDRLVGIDLARCLALLGMMATHVLDARTPGGDVSASHWLASGRASALFAVLAGVSIALVSGRGTPVVGGQRLRVSAALVVRAVLVGAIGLLLGTLDTGIAVILTYYAVLFVLALPFLGLTARPLLAVAVAWVAAAPVVSHLARPELPPRQFDSPEPEQLLEPGRLVAELLFTGYYPAVPWVAYLLLGLAIGRADLRSRRVAAVLVVNGAVAAVGATLLSRALTSSRFDWTELDAVAGGMYGQTPTDNGWRWLLVVVPHSTTPFDLVQTGGSAALVVGLCLLVAGAARDLSPVVERALQVLVGAGAMTLTLFVLHVVMRTDAVWPPEEPSTYAWHVLVALWIGSVYAALGRRGPLETVVGWLPGKIRGRSSG
ncbi:heparan-alpha-glucosaminide N-acetyltransferase domain-containing protein [Nocardioides litoris]|uniref:heparan-alpha-glucosaminide N-acetyltransferase domain-containing protein n=1 Tax=Nocardioides litoris TaxID=1926648 RepID=UPI0011203920|nr:heparan-alpha-glucosaminide N-acetyltransferase domain-containing protein [Nocardioides litoris]